jgi:ribose transport system permease protein
MRRFLAGPFAGPLIALAVVAAAVALTTDRFLEGGNLSNLVLQVSIISIVAIGSSFVIFTGGIDLSPGSMIALLTMVFAMTVKLGGFPLAVGVVVVLLRGTALGLVNGVLTAYLRIPSFITTLAALSAFRGIAFMFNKGSPIFSVSPHLERIFYGKLFHVPLPLFYVVVLYAAASWFLRNTAPGRAIYAVGGSASAARLSGISVRRTQLLAFLVAGLTAGVGAVLMAARLNSGSPNYGVGLELSAIAAAVIGGASFTGGSGSVLGATLGVVLIALINNGFVLLHGSPNWQQAVSGFILLVAVGVDAVRTRRERRE